VPENPRIALTAVLMTGVVGVVGAVATYKAANDAQSEAGRAAVIKEDRAELREVLDRSYARLSEAENVGSDLYLRLRSRKGFEFSALAPLRSAVDAATLSEGQLAVRLSRESDVYRAYADAVSSLREMTLMLVQDPTGQRVDEFEDERDEFFDQEAKFLRAANRFARSVLR
jgi:hypothetical protein